jgi:hypothetical protein
VIRGVKRIKENYKSKNKFCVAQSLTTEANLKPVTTNPDSGPNSPATDLSHFLRLRGLQVSLGSLRSPFRGAPLSQTTVDGEESCSGVLSFAMIKNTEL